MEKLFKKCKVVMLATDKAENAIINDSIVKVDTFYVIKSK